MLRAPFPYFGYKGQISASIWERLGDVPNYVEPFAGSLAVLLQRPQPGKREVVNDVYGLLANFWRSVKADPEQVADHAVHVASESDVHARNAFCRESIDTITPRLEGDPEWYDAKIAGWWCYVQCLAIGEVAYARGPWVRQGGLLVNGGSSADGVRRAIPFHGEQGLLARRASALAWLTDLSERLTSVRILCGDWSRACKPTYTVQHGLTGVYLDPPYGDGYKTYANHDPLLEKLCAWCLDAGPNPLYRVALSGYEGTLPVDLVSLGWTELAWTAKGGYVTTGGQSDANRRRERVWLSPHCLGAASEGQLDLLGGVG